MSYSNIKEYLNNSVSKNGNKPTHARIGNQSLNIRGGSYFINYENEVDFKTFKKLYCKNVFDKKGGEYLTELQDRENGGPILIDLDFKFEKSQTERIIDETIVVDIVDMYSEQITSIFSMENIKTFEIYVSMKDNISVTQNFSKDGLHIQINLICKHNKQLFLREKIKNKIYNEVFVESGIEFKNNVDDIFDKSISSGQTGWLLLGSKKPGGEPYKVISRYIVTVEEDDYTIEEVGISDESIKKTFEKLLIRNQKYETLEISEKFKDEFENYSNKNKKVVKTNNSLILNQSSNKLLGQGLLYDNFKKILTEEACDNMIMLVLENNNSSKTEKIKEIYEYMMECLDEKYYEPFTEWVRVLWASKNTSDMLYPFFLKWSSQSKEFSWSDTFNIEKIYKMWEDGKNRGLTEGSIRHWARTNNHENYEIIRNNSTNHYIENTLTCSGSDHDIAKLIRHLYFDRYRCVGIKGNLWYAFTSHRWIESECGTGLREKYSSVVSQMFITKQNEIIAKIRSDDNMSAELQDTLTSQAAIYNKISMRLRDAPKKNQILTESKELHYDKNLIMKLDENPFLICFTNGVYDFEQELFRDGIPEDYVSKCTRIEYVDISKEEHKQTKILINDFMAKLFPNKNLRKYMWEYLGSLMLGTNQNQTFNLFTGVGSNGKSMLVKFVSLAMGDYKGTVPISLVTQKRLGLGGTSSEVAQLKGIRFAVMNEPSKGDKINEGIMKELTGGDPIQARELYKSSIIFTPAFKMACCTNTLFDIESNDDGTWRRIRVVEFESKFLDNPSKNPEDKEFPKDKDLESKLPEWAPVFAAMLIDVVNKTKGIVTDCEEVLAPSKKYRESQDYLAKFISDKIKKSSDPKKKISKTNIVNEFKEWWKREYSRKSPKAQELVDYLNIKLGPYKDRGWRGYEIIYEDYDTDDD